MRFVRFISSVALVVSAGLLAPGGAFAASKEQMEMQRDIAQIQEQVRALQSAFDQKMAALQTLVEQALDAGQKANTSVSVLASNVSQTIDRQLQERLTPVAGLSAKVDNVSNDVSEIRNAISDLNTQMNRMQQALTDVNNQLKVMQTPPPPPPGTDSTGQIPNGAASAAPVSAQALFDAATTDYTTGKTDLAISEFKDFLARFPDDPNAPGAQENLGLAHMGLGKYDLAAKDFDAVLERYPDNGNITRDCWLDKGMALKSGGHRDEAIKVFRELYRKYPTSGQGRQAANQLTAMGVSKTAPSAAAAHKRAAN